MRKTRENGQIALVLPLSAVSGVESEKARKAVSNQCRDIIVVTIAGARPRDSSFSADTKMADCLLIAQKGKPVGEARATFVMLRRRPESAVEAEQLAGEIDRIRVSGQLRSVERLEGGSAIAIGEQQLGEMLDAPLPETGPWPFVGILDAELAQVAWNLERGRFVPLGQPGSEQTAISVVPIEQIAGRGLYHADIYWDQADGSPRGPFDLIKPAASAAPTYPMLWAHDNTREHKLFVEPDSEGRIKDPSGRVTQDALNRKAGDVWGSATRAHYNRDFQFNSQSLIVAMTERPCIGGRSLALGHIRG